MEFEIVEILVAIGIGFIALAALGVSLASEYRARSNIRTQLFMNLRREFLEVYSALPPQFADTEWEPSNETEKSSILNYWHYSFSEWFVTNRLAKRRIGDLWESFYKGAILSALERDCFRNILVERFMKREDKYTAEFLGELDKLWAKTHMGHSDDCDGLLCKKAHLKPRAIKETSGGS